MLGGGGRKADRPARRVPVESDLRPETGERPYVVDTRPLCQGMPFILTDAACPRLVLKNGSHFLVLDQGGGIPACNTLGYGYYRYDTRHISEWEFSLDGLPLSMLSSSVFAGYAGRFLYTNVQMGDLPQQKIIIHRETVLLDRLWERITFENFHTEPIRCGFKIKFQSDFADIFEVRGLNRSERGQRMVPLAGADGHSLFLAYRGLDNQLLETIIQFSFLKPTLVSEGDVTFELDLPVKTSAQLQICVSTAWEKGAPPADPGVTSYREARKVADARYEVWRSQGSSVSTSNDLFNLSLEHSFRDLYILRQPTPKGWGLAAGLPWFAAIFGRDSAIAAAQVLPFFPDIGRESIEVLAAYQGKRSDDFSEERPGRIMHELRLGELARTGEVPHKPYYGTVDATQLWLLLFCEYLKWTGDLEFARRLWPRVKDAIAFLDRECQGGFISYRRVSEEGLENQGWKDSFDSVMHVDGTFAEAPIALCEAQGYLYSARLQVADVAEILGHRKMAGRLRDDAERLKLMFQRDFWMEDEKFVAMALDGQGRQVRVLSSNPGHCLATGILGETQAQLVADRLMNPEFHTGWGIRTLASSNVSFSPIAYHNGTVWPHDNAMIAGGMRKLGRIEDVHRIFLELFEVAQHKPDFRLPELFCGFDRDEAAGPIDYPVSCSPQAFAASSLSKLLAVCINFEPDACNKTLRIVEPSLPEWLGEVTVTGLRVGDAVLDLSLVTRMGSTSCQLLRKSGDLKVIFET